MLVHDENLPFFNGLSGRLRLQLSESPEPISTQLDNLKAAPATRLLGLSIEWAVFDGGGLRALTDEEWSRPVLLTERLRLRAYGCDRVVEHPAPEGGPFTVRDLAVAVEKTEREGRPHTTWFGGMDVHHVFFEGIHREGESDTWAIRCGS